MPKVSDDYRSQRIKSIRLAIRRVETGRVRNIKPGTPMTIKAVALEAGVDPSTIHTVYPDLAEHVRALAGRQRRLESQKAGAVAEELEKRLKDAHLEIDHLKHELASVSSRYATCTLLVKQLEALLTPAARRLYEAARRHRA